MLRIEKDVQSPVGFKYRVLDLTDIEAALLSKLLHQLVKGEAASAQLALVDDPV